MNNKRNYRRLSLDNNIILKFESNLDRVIEGRLLDISFVGICVFLNESVNIDKIVQEIVQFDIAGFTEQNFIGRGKIVYVKLDRIYAKKGFRVGLMFIEADKGFVLNILNRLELKSADQAKRKGQSLFNNFDMF
ncbi:MAG: hypothetical protein Q8N62_04840 [Candidatus Omnitrophota bacterium]|nr:hypothetical protein [Candidatus Omnitrophota bacterium]